MQSEAFADAARLHPKAFRRNRSLPLPTLTAFLLGGPRRSLQSELDTFFDQLAPTANLSVSKSACCQARMNLNPAALAELLRLSANLLTDRFNAARWQGLRVLALDTTVIRVPNNPECALHFSYMNTSCGKWRALARASALWDVSRQCFVDAVLGAYAETDRDLALRHLPALTCKDLVIMDRGYPSRDLMRAFHERGIPFCARITTRNWGAVNRFVRSDRTDQVVEMGDRHQALPLRLLRHVLPNGATLVLVTNVLSPEVSPTDFAELYRQRWRIEEAFKHIKARLQIENWSGCLPVTVEQDFHATLVRANCAACLRLAALPAGLPEAVNDALSSGWRRRQNMAYSVSCLQGFLPRLLLLPDRSGLLERLIARLSGAGGHVITRSGRSAKRVIGVRIQGFHSAYKAA